MIKIDGEGGGQMIRSSLTLAALADLAVHIRHIRSGRKHPGLVAHTSPTSSCSS